MSSARPCGLGDKEGGKSGGKGMEYRPFHDSQPAPLIDGDGKAEVWTAAISVITASHGTTASNAICLLILDLLRLCKET